MSLRDFLLDYAEKAPKAKRVTASLCVRFERPDSPAVPCCPIELASEEDHWIDGAQLYFGAMGRYDPRCRLITNAADLQFTNGMPQYRAWRAVLEKLAEPEPEARDV